MDGDVMDALQELGCFSAVGGAIDQVADIVEQDPIDDLWIDIGGEG